MCMDEFLMRLTLPYPPSVNTYWRQVNNRIYTTHEAKKYKQTVAKQCTIEGHVPLDGSVAVDIKVFRPAKRGDLDNTLKVSLDSLKGFCFHDDKQIVKIVAERYDDKDNPRIEIEITQLDHDFLAFNLP